MITYQNTGQQENVYFHKKIAKKCKMFSSLQHWHIGTLAHWHIYHYIYAVTLFALDILIHSIFLKSECEHTNRLFISVQFRSFWL